MVDITKVYTQKIKSFKFVGKKYYESDRVNGSFNLKWKEWFQNDWFNIIEKQKELTNDNVYEDDSAYIGLIKCNPQETFEYWIGMFVPKTTMVPDGFESIDFPTSNLGVCWVCGKEQDVYCKESLCVEKLIASGYQIKSYWSFERYCNPRFMVSDDNDNITLDVDFFVE